MARRILGSGWWSRPPAPPQPTAAGRDVTGRLLQALQWALHGSGQAGEQDPGDCGAVTLAAAHYARAMAGATVTAAEPTAGAIRRILATAGRGYIERGEALFLVHAGAEGLALEPVTLVDGAGTWDAPTWRVRRTQPSGDWQDVRVRPDRLLHVIFNPDPGAGGLTGRPPWEGTAARAAANLEGQLGDVGALPSGHALRIHSPAEWDDEALAELYEGLQDNYGHGNRSGFAPHLTQGAGEGATSFLDTYRGEFDPASAPLVEALTGSVAASCGIPPVLLSRTVAGAGYRDAWRSFVTTSVQSACDVLAAAVVDQLGVACSIEARARHNTPADLVSRARAAKSLTDAEVEPERALALVGLAGA